MHQLAYPIHSSLKYDRMTQKERLEDCDLQVVADMVCDGIREGLYGDIIPNGSRSEVIQFLRHLVTRCEIRQYQPSKKCFRKRVAALQVYTAEGVVIGFSILAEALSRTIEKGIDLLMLGVASVQRGLGYGASILDSLIRSVSRHSFNLIVRCPTDSQLLFAMLVTRGFVAVNHYGRGHTLRFFPVAGRGAFTLRSKVFRYVE